MCDGNISVNIKRNDPSNPLHSLDIDNHINYYIECRNDTRDNTYNANWLDGAIYALKGYKQCMIDNNITITKGCDDHYLHT